MCGCGRSNISYSNNANNLSVVPNANGASAAGYLNQQYSYSNNPQVTGLPFANIQSNPNASNISSYLSQEFSYTNNPQVTGSAAATIALSDLPYGNNVTFAPSVSAVAKSPFENSAFTNYLVVPSSTYVNTCPLGPYLSG